MSFKFEILENEDKNTLVLSSDKEIYNTRVVFNDDSKSEQFPLVKQLFFLPDTICNICSFYIYY